MLISVVAHLAALGVALQQRDPGPPPDRTTILPALYLYAPERRPVVPREFRLPVADRPGSAVEVGDDVVLTALVDAAVPAHPERPRGLPLPGPDEVLLDSVFSALAVDSEVVRDPTSAAPAYPDDLRQEGLEGSVEVEFVVDTTGRVDLATVRILQSSHPDFQAAVETALAGMHFRPAWRGWRRVRQLVQQRFAFRLVRPPEEGTRL